MLGINKKEFKGADIMQNLIIGTHKDNYYVAAAYIYRILNNADIIFSRADKIHEKLKELVNTNYKNIYIVAMRLKQDYIPDIIDSIKKMLEKKKEIKWFVLPDRVHIHNGVDNMFFKSILKIPAKNQTLIDIIKNDFNQSESDDYMFFNKLYKFIEEREINRSKNIKTMDLQDELKILEHFANYIEYVRYNFFKNSFEGMDLLRELIEKLAYKLLTPEDIKKSYGKGFYDRHITGESKLIINLNRQISKVGKDPDISVVIYGETGTGKEVVAKLLHDASGRQGLFIPLNCTAVPEALMESILFGYVKGAHSQAFEDKKGIFEEADGGTVFLDEIGDMPLHLQSKLLRIIEDRVVRRIGAESKPISVDFRLICATNKNLKKLISENKFRQDLYFRIARYEITIPPLRERKEDIELIAMEILYEFYMRGKCPRIILNKKQIEALKSYDWAGGNVRELQTFLERAIIDEDFEFEKKIQELKQKNNDLYGQNFKLKTLNEIEKEAIINTLMEYNGNKTHTAKTLGISLNTLKAKMKKYGLV